MFPSLLPHTTRSTIETAPKLVDFCVCKSYFKNVVNSGATSLCGQILNYKNHHKTRHATAELAIYWKLTFKNMSFENFLNKDGDEALLEELSRRKDNIPQYDWNNCNKKQFEDRELHDALFNHMNGSSSPGPDGFTIN